MEISDELIRTVLSNNIGSVISPSEALLILRCLATNPDTQPEVLEQLSNHSSTEIVERVAENPSSGDKILARLVSHPEATVRAAVSNNPKAAKHLLWVLIQDKSSDVRYHMAENPTLPRDIIEALGADENPYVSHRAFQSLRKVETHSYGIVGRIAQWFERDKRTQSG